MLLFFSVMRFWVVGLLMWMVLSPVLFAQELIMDADTSAHQDQDQDTTVIDTSTTIRFHESKRIDEEELANKKSGYFITGLPEFEKNPINGIGIGGNFYLYNNGKKESPFFAYTPYRQRYTGSFKVFQSGKWQGAVNMDFVYIFDTRWRVRLDAVFENDPNYQYYGFGKNTLKKLRFRDKISGNMTDYARFDAYFDNLAIVRAGNTNVGEDNLVTDRHYNEVDYTENLYNILAERVFLGGRLRVMIGYELLFIKIKDYFGRTAEEAFDAEGNVIKDVRNGRTKLTEDYLHISEGTPWQQYNIAGYSGGREGIIAFACTYDTRDFEPDPSKGVFIQYSHEHSHAWTLSEFSFDKNMAQVIWFQKLFPKYIKRMVFASNFSLGYIWGQKVPFYEAFDLSSQAEAGGTEVLGGARSLRGFREYRFVGPLTALINIELRTRLVEFNFIKQHFSLALIPFMDAGRVWDRMAEFSWHGYKHNYGVGGRIGWNQSTILRFDFALSSESRQFFFGFGNIF